MRRKILAFFLWIGIPIVAFCGLESGTYISDLVATNPLSSDQASTADDHIRLLKSTIKNTFPNLNGAVSSTDEELSLLSGKTGTVWTSANDGSGSGLDADTIDGTAIVGSQIWTSANDGSGSGLDADTIDGTAIVGSQIWTSANDGAASGLDADLLDGISSAGFCQTGGSGCPTIATGANPSATIGLSATNGSAGTYMRSDAAPALSQAIAPTWTNEHIFSKVVGGTTYGIEFASTTPGFLINQTDASAENKYWNTFVSGEQLNFRILNDAGNSDTAWLTVDRTGTTVDRVTFPTTTGSSFVVGSTAPTPSIGAYTMHVSSNGTAPAAVFYNKSATNPTVFIGSDQASGNTYIQFFDGTDPDSETGHISTNGTTTTYSTTSDARLKENFYNAPSAKSVIDCIKVESYDWKQTKEHVVHGLVAQRLNKCAPYAVSSSDDPKKIWGIDPSKLVPAMIKYMQEQEQRINKLEAQIRRMH